MIFICTFNASKVTFIHFLFEWRIACSFCQKTVWTNVKFLDGSVFKTEPKLNFGFPHIPTTRMWKLQEPMNIRHHMDSTSLTHGQKNVAKLHSCIAACDKNVSCMLRLKSATYLGSETWNSSGIQTMCNSFLSKCHHKASPCILVQCRKCLHLHFHCIKRLTDIHRRNTTCSQHKCLSNLIHGANWQKVYNFLLMMYSNHVSIMHCFLVYITASDLRQSWGLVVTVEIIDHIRFLFIGKAY